jgi:hypothetical protein
MDGFTFNDLAIVIVIFITAGGCAYITNMLLKD